MRAWRAGEATTAQLRAAVRFTLEELAELAPGNSVEVRVPPWGVTQVIEGPRHTRGTPPNTVEMDPLTWLGLALGEKQWAQERADGRVVCSGTRADLAEYLPLPAVLHTLAGNTDSDEITSIP